MQFLFAFLHYFLETLHEELANLGLLEVDDLDGGGRVEALDDVVVVVAVGELLLTLLSRNLVPEFQRALRDRATFYRGAKFLRLRQLRNL